MPGLIRPVTDHREPSYLPKLKPNPNLYPRAKNLASQKNLTLYHLPPDLETPTTPRPPSDPSPTRIASNALDPDIMCLPEKGKPVETVMAFRPCGLYQERPSIITMCSSSSSESGSNGNPHNEPSSVCLAAMVDEFMESEYIYRACNQSDRVHHAMLNDDYNAKNRSLVKDYFTQKDSLETNSMKTSDMLQSLQCLVIHPHLDEVEALLLKDVEKILQSLSAQETGLMACSEDGRRNENVTHRCIKRIVMNRLQKLGYNAAICRSRWDHTGGISAGEYEYIDVVFVTDAQYRFLKQPMRLIVDLDFQAQFEIARPSDDFSMIWQLLPPIFIGAPDKLQQIVLLMSEATKKSLREEGLHLPPWRKLSYLKAKWFSSYKRTSNCNVNATALCKDGERICTGFTSSTKHTNEFEMLYHGLNAVQPTDINNILITDNNHIHKKAGMEISGLILDQKCASKDIVLKKQNDKDKITVLASDWQLPAIANKRLDPTSESKQGVKVIGLVSLMLKSHDKSAHGIMAGAS